MVKGSSDIGNEEAGLPDPKGPQIPTQDDVDRILDKIALAPFEINSDEVPFSHEVFLRDAVLEYQLIIIDAHITIKDQTIEFDEKLEWTIKKALAIELSIFSGLDRISFVLELCFFRSCKECVGKDSTACEACCGKKRVPLEQDP